MHYSAWLSLTDLLCAGLCVAHFLVVVRASSSSLPASCAQTALLLLWPHSQAPPASLAASQSTGCVAALAAPSFSLACILLQLLLLTLAPACVPAALSLARPPGFVLHFACSLDPRGSWRPAPLSSLLFGLVLSVYSGRQRYMLWSCTTLCLASPPLWLLLSAAVSALALTRWLRQHLQPSSCRVRRISSHSGAALSLALATLALDVVVGIFATDVRATTFV